MSVKFEAEGRGLGGSLKLVEHHQHVLDAERLQVGIGLLAQPCRQFEVFVERLVGVVLGHLQRLGELIRVEATDGQTVARLLGDLPLDRAVEGNARQRQ